MSNLDVKFNNGNGTVLCNICRTMLVDHCVVSMQIDCAHICDDCYDNLKGDRLAQLEEFVRYIAHDYVELSHDKVLWQRNDYINAAKRLLK